ncbi:UDP-4-amino-4,6-dideoxy-N-acetyl-beta-L-altrosamine N-acetyltransferase [Billgrantia montanilacus]|uniref:UDP-4-amino-4, 6-dideoxy-N-acetyl-beta-L-altrosamine N-acetyltransferase n=2 Tax=Billgrantia montanilacus TaxID=2282305 RepID=A0A368TXJ9_9GAMM|nr:UDP-4-amino-4,6-dideoxy-N-acetyl-beta-L-altrosamine N-acetyltransferase [Halomonas montanilacus]
MSESDLSLVLKWRNHPSIRRFMYTQHNISLQEHRKWFEAANDQKNKYLLIYEIKGNPLGFISIERENNTKVADWGFYASPDAPKGTGTDMGNAALEYAFIQLALHKICGHALAYNHRSVKFHEKLGFLKEGVLRDQHFDGETYHDIICFGLLENEWYRTD